jgi:hypothetical protein
MSIQPGKMRVSISSPPDREKLVAEVLYENEQWAEINQESGLRSWCFIRPVVVSLGGSTLMKPWTH